jgi:queuine/archaeosine tRNA-ribosyltransferase
MAEIRTSIKEGVFAQFYQKFYKSRNVQENEREIDFPKFQMGR